jgi:hypothetical protein
MYTLRKLPKSKRTRGEQCAVLIGAPKVGKTTLASICVECARTPIDVITSPALVVLMARPTIVDVNPTSVADVQRLADMRLLGSDAHCVHVVREGRRLASSEAIEAAFRAVGCSLTTLPVDDLEQGVVRLYQLLGVTE